jgi:hypothetical protein
MTIEQRLDKLEKQNKRFKIAFTELAVALCGVVSMAATDRVGVFEAVFAKAIYVKDDSGIKVAIGVDSNGGFVSLYNKTGEEIVQLTADDYGKGEVRAYNRKGKGRVYGSQ